MESPTPSSGAKARTPASGAKDRPKLTHGDLVAQSHGLDQPCRIARVLGDKAGGWGWTKVRYLPGFIAAFIDDPDLPEGREEAALKSMADPWRKIGEPQQAVHHEDLQAKGTDKRELHLRVEAAPVVLNPMKSRPRTMTGRLEVLLSDPTIGAVQPEGGSGTPASGGKSQGGWNCHVSLSDAPSWLKLKSAKDQEFTKQITATPKKWTVSVVLDQDVCLSDAMAGEWPPALPIRFSRGETVLGTIDVPVACSWPLETQKKEGESHIRQDCRADRSSCRKCSGRWPRVPFCSPARDAGVATLSPWRPCVPSSASEMTGSRSHCLQPCPCLSGSRSTRKLEACGARDMARSYDICAPNLLTAR